MYTKNGRVYFEPVRDFWIADNKIALLNYLTQQYPQSSESLYGMKKDQLQSIYIKTRRERG